MDDQFPVLVLAEGELNLDVLFKSVVFDLVAVGVNDVHLCKLNLTLSLP